jgi:hypothetical protein
MSRVNLLDRCLISRRRRFFLFRPSQVQSGCLAQVFFYRVPYPTYHSIRCRRFPCRSLSCVWPLLGWLSRNISWVTLLFLDAASLSGVGTLEREKIRRKRLETSSREKEPLDHAAEKHIWLTLFFSVMHVPRYFYL